MSDTGPKTTAKPARSAPFDPARAMRERNAAAAERPAPERPATLAAYRRDAEARRTLARPKTKSTR